MVSRKRVYSKNQKVLKIISRHIWWWGIDDELGEYRQLARQEGYTAELQIFLYLAQIWYLKEYVYPMDKWKTDKEPRYKLWKKNTFNQKKLAAMKEDLKAFKEALEDEILLY
jgi:hypothetical protein